MYEPFGLNGFVAIASVSITKNFVSVNNLAD